MRALSRQTAVAVSLASLLTFTTPGAAAGQPTYTTLLYVGEQVPGRGVVQQMRDVAVNDLGDWIIVADTDVQDAFSGRFVLRNDVVSFAQGDPVDPPGYTVQLIARTPELNASNDIGWSFDVGTSVGDAVDRLYVNETALLEHFDPCAAPQCPPGTMYDVLSAAKINDDGDLLVAASLNIPDDGVRHGLVRFTLGANGLIDSEQIVVKEGDVLNGPDIPLGTIGLTDRDFDWNNKGLIGLIAEYAEGGPSSDDALFLNGTPVVTEGAASPVDGLDFGGMSRVRVNDADDWALWCTLTDGSTFVPTILRNGDVFAMVGEDFMTSAGAFEVKFMLLYAGDLTDAGDVFWMANLGTKLTLLVGDKIILREDATIVDGHVVTDIGAFAAVSPSGRYVLATVELDFTTTKTILIDRRPCPADVASPANGAVDVRDLFVLLNNWGTAGPGADLAAPSDVVDVLDLFVLLSAWGPCM